LIVEAEGLPHFGNAFHVFATTMTRGMTPTCPTTLATFPDAGDCMAWSMDHVAGPDGPVLHFLHDMEDDEPVPLAIS
jgi:hypothetical protein